MFGSHANRIDTRLLTAELLTVGTAVVLAVAPIPSSWVESWYCTATYPRLERTLTPFSNLIPFAILDVLLVTVISTAAIRLISGTQAAWRARAVAPLGRTIFHLLATTAALYIAFLALWGLNYRRVPMPDRLVLDGAAPTSEQVVARSGGRSDRTRRRVRCASQRAVGPGEPRPIGIRSEHRHRPDLGRPVTARPAEYVADAAARVMPCQLWAKPTTSQAPVAILAKRSMASFDSAPVVSSSTLFRGGRAPPAFRRDRSPAAKASPRTGGPGGRSYR